MKWPLFSDKTSCIRVMQEVKTIMASYSSFVMGSSTLEFTNYSSYVCIFQVLQNFAKSKRYRGTRFTTENTSKVRHLKKQKISFNHKGIFCCWRCCLLRLSIAINANQLAMLQPRLALWGLQWGTPMRKQSQMYTTFTQTPQAYIVHTVHKCTDGSTFQQNKL